MWFQKKLAEKQAFVSPQASFIRPIYLTAARALLRALKNGKDARKHQLLTTRPTKFINYTFSCELPQTSSYALHWASRNALSCVLPA